jgi:DNA-binding transcriptional regulator YiaG
VKTNHLNEKPDKAGSRAARTAHFSAMLIAWRTRKGLTRQEAARILCCTERTISQWERRRALPQGVSLSVIIDGIEGGTI